MFLANSEVRSVRGYTGRFLVPVILAAAVTFLCLLVMQRLILVKPAIMQTDMIKLSAPPVSLDYLESPRELRPRIVKVIPSEPPVSVDDQGVFEPPGVRLAVGQISQDSFFADLINAQAEQFLFSAPVTDLVPLIVVNPAYPFGAQVRGIEGEVLVEFSINMEGRVVNPWVVEAQPKGVFDKAVLSAIGQFRFRAPRLDGVSFPVSGTRMKFYFRLDDLLNGIRLSLSEDSALEKNVY